MKIKVYLAIAVTFFGLQAVTAQDVKIGYTNIEYILSFLPETKQIEAEVKDFEKQLSSQLESKYSEFQEKVKNFQDNAQNMIPEVRMDRQQELQSMEQSIQKFQKDAQASMQRKQMELLQPAYDKIQKAIDEVAKENGYTHVLSSDQGGVFVLLYARDEDNISDLVFRKLGVEPPVDEEE
ncbi:MAG: OmpH family outer membrane protein [Cyclobacteriaceae bacterium]